MRVGCGGGVGKGGNVYIKLFLNYSCCVLLGVDVGREGTSFHPKETSTNMVQSPCREPVGLWPRPLHFICISAAMRERERERKRMPTFF